MIVQDLHRASIVLIFVASIVGCTGSNLPLDQRSSFGKAIHSNNSSSGGNGEFYGGKPDPGVYVRQVPNLNCSKRGYAGKIVVTKTSAIATLVDPSDCSISRQELSLDTLEFIEYNKGQISLSEGIYSKPNEINEVWCREEGSTSVEGFDVVIKADYKLQKFQSSVIAGKLTANGTVERTEYTNPIGKRRIEAGESIRYRSDDFELDIRTRTMNAATGTMIGEFTYEKNGFNASRNLRCRLGGELDLMAPSRPYEVALEQVKHVIKSLLAWIGVSPQVPGNNA